MTAYDCTQLQYTTNTTQNSSDNLSSYLQTNIIAQMLSIGGGGITQGQYWAGRTPPPNNGLPNMAAANFVVISNGEGCALNGAAIAAMFIDQ